MNYFKLFITNIFIFFREKKKLGILILIAVGILWIGIRHVSKKEEAKIYVEISHPIRKELIDTIATSGTISAEKESMLSSKIPGKIKFVYIKEGDSLTAHQKLIELESKELTLKKEIAESAHRSAASAIDEENYKRHKILLQEGVITKSEFDKIESEYKSAEADRERLEKTVELQKEEEEASLISSPFEALTAKILVHEGEVVQAGQPLVHLVNMNSVFITTPISSKNIHRIQNGMKAWVDIDGSQENVTDKFTGQIDTISPVADPLSRTFDVKVKIQNKNQTLKPGMFAKVNIITDRRPNALTIPKEALIKKDGLEGTQIYIIQNDRAHMQKIKVGLETTRDLEVIEPNLDLNTPVVTAGQSELFENAPVEITHGP